MECILRWLDPKNRIFALRNDFLNFLLNIFHSYWVFLVFVSQKDLPCKVTHHFFAVDGYHWFKDGLRLSLMPSKFRHWNHRHLLERHISFLPTNLTFHRLHQQLICIPHCFKTFTQSLSYLSIILRVFIEIHTHCFLNLINDVLFWSLAVWQSCETLTDNLFVSLLLKSVTNTRLIQGLRQLIACTI